MKKNLLIVGAFMLALAGVVVAGGPELGRGNWFGHSALYPATQTIAAQGTVAADACGGLKRIQAFATVTSSTVYTFAAPTASNAGCMMDVVNVSTNIITLDANILFLSSTTAGYVLGSSDTIRVVQTGGFWAASGGMDNQ